MSQLIRPTVGRSVHLKVQPRPQSIAECRQVLQALRIYGEIEMFRHLKYEAIAPAPNSFLAIFKDKQSAEQATRSDPVDLTYTDRIRSLEAQSSKSNNRSNGDDRSALKPSERRQIATISIDISRMEHEAYIARQPYCGQYGRTVSALVDDLYTKLPDGMDGMAYMDYGKKEIPWRIRAKRTVTRGTKTLKTMSLSMERNPPISPF